MNKAIIDLISTEACSIGVRTKAEGFIDYEATRMLNNNILGIYDNKAYVPKFGGEFNMKTNKDGGVKVGKYWVTRVIHNNPATIVFWNDGTKTVARTQDGDPYNPTAGLLVCVLKKMVGNDQTQKLLNDWAVCDIEEYGPMFGEDYVYTDITMKDVRKKHRRK